MIRTLVIPNQTNLIVKIPNNYIGDKMEITCIALDEVEEIIEKPKNLLSKYKGALNLSEHQQREFEKYVNDGRAEWNKKCN